LSIEIASHYCYRRVPAGKQRHHSELQPDNHMKSVEKCLLGLILVFLSAIFVSNARAANPIQVENANPGTTDWQITNYALNHEIEGYASLTSVNRGGQIQLFVNTADRNFTIEIFRTGWYGGMGGRRITSPVQLSGTAQPSCPTTDQATGLIECNWTNPYVLQVPNNAADPSDWASGVYLAKLTGASGKQSYIVFTVRDDSRPSSYLFQNSVNTYQAYNNWGGRSLYAYNSDFQARKVSFNRPYADSYGAGQFLFQYEYPTVRFLEREGYDLTYATDVDLHENPNLLASKNADLIIGHGEYWSWEMRTNAEAARDRGVSLGFFAANSCYWQVRFEPGTAGGAADRTMVGYKDFALMEDPDYTGGDPTKYHLVTTNWRAFPVNLPEDALIGVLYSNVVQTGDIVVFNSSNFVFNNTGLQNGSHLPGLMGVEVDSLGSNTPPGTVLLSHSPYQFQGSTLFSDMTVYTAASGATVFAAGTIIWDQGLDDFNGGPVSAAAQQMTRNLLARFVANQALVASPGGPYSGTVSQNIQFDGSGSTDSSGTITSYAWDFGDGGTGTGVTTSHAYSAVGIYTVSLTVTDNHGATNTAQTTATISNSSSVSLSSVSVNPTSVSGGTSSTGTVTLSGTAPTGGANVSLTSSNTTAAQVPASVTVAAGATTATFTVTTNSVSSVTNVTITGTYNSGAKTATLTVNPVSVSGQIAFVQQKTAIYSSAASVIATLSAAPHPASALVLFSANNNVNITGVSGGGVTWVRGSSSSSHSVVEIWYGLNSSGTGTAITVNYTNATGSGAVNVSEFSGVATTNALDVAPAPSNGVSTTPTSPTAATNNPNDLVLAAAADTSVGATTSGPTNSFIALTEASNSNKIIPAYRIVTASGSYSTTWTEPNGGWDSAIVALKAAGTSSGPSLSSVTLNPASVTGGTSSTGTVTLSGAAPTGGATVTLTSSNTTAAQVPASVTVAAGSTTTTFTATTSAVGSITTVTITGSYNSGTKTATLTVNPASSISLSSVTLSPTSVTGGSSSTGTVTLSGAAPTGGASVSLTSSNTTAAQVPISVNVAAGSTTATFTVTTSSVASVTSVTITGTYNSGSKSATLTVNPGASVSLSSVTLNPTSVTGGNSSTGTVTLSGAAPTGGATISLTSSNTAAVQVPASVTVATGSTTTTFTATTSSVTSVTAVSITGTYNSGTKTATLTVNPGSVSGPIAFVQQKTATYSTAARVVATLGIAPRPGSALVLFSANNNVNITGVSGGGVTWVRGASSGSHSVVEIWYGLNSSGSGRAITVNYTNATGSGGVNVSEFSGVVTTNARDVAATRTGSSATPTTPTITTTNSNDLIVAAVAVARVGATTGGPTNSFIALTEAANKNKIVPAYRIVAVTGSYSTGWTEPNDGWDAAILALK
jgi:PKD repeat protein